MTAPFPGEEIPPEAGVTVPGSSVSAGAGVGGSSVEVTSCADTGCGMNIHRIESASKVKRKVDTVIFNNGEIKGDVLKIYLDKNFEPVINDLENINLAECLASDLILEHPELIRHDYKKLAGVLEEVIK